MSIRVLQVLAGLFALAAVLLVLVGWRLASSVSQQSAVDNVSGTPSVPNQPLAKAPAYPALVAVNEMTRGHQIQEQDLRHVDFPFPVAAGVANTNELVGKILSKPVQSGNVVSHADIDSLPGVVSHVNPGMRAVAISIDEIVSVGAHLTPGDLVDVHYVSSGSLSSESRVGRTLFQNLTVLSVGADYIDGEGASENSNRSARSVVLEVPEPLAPVLTLADISGALRLALVGQDEQQALAFQVAESQEGLDLILSNPNVEGAANIYQLSDFVMPSSASSEADSTARNSQGAERYVVQHIGREVSRVSIPE